MKTYKIKNKEGVIIYEEADLRGADLRGANLRGADLKGADLKEADLRRANLRGCGVLSIVGFRWAIVCNNDSLQIGCKTHTITEWEAFPDDVIQRMDRSALSFWKEHKDVVLALAKTARLL